jgi:hypothetical protein
MLYPRRRAAGFFLQFPKSAFTGIFTGVQPSCRDFVQIALCGISILADQEDLRVFCSGFAKEGNYRARSRMSDHLQFTARTIREANGVHIERYDFPGIRAA